MCRLFKMLSALTCLVQVRVTAEPAMTEDSLNRREINRPTETFVTQGPRWIVFSVLH